MSKSVCPAGQHPIDWTYRSARWVMCEYDAAGAGLPWDTTTLLAAAGCLLALGSVIGYLLYLHLNRK